MCLAVIRPALCRRRNNKCFAILCDLQRAFVLRDRVVVGIEVFACRVGDRVRYFTFRYRRYGTGRLDIGRFTFYESVSAYGHGRLRQRRAVIRLLTALGRQRNASLRDLQFTYGKRSRLVVSGSNVPSIYYCEDNIVYSRLFLAFNRFKRTGIISDILSLCRNILNSQNVIFSKPFDRIIISGDRFARTGNDQFILNKSTQSALFRSVVNLLSILNSNRQASLLNGQLAKGSCNLIVRGLSLAPSNIISIVAAPHLSLCSSH